MGRGQRGPSYLLRARRGSSDQEPPRPAELETPQGTSKDFPPHRPNGWTLSIPVCRSAAYPPVSGRSKSLQRARVLHRPVSTTLKMSVPWGMTTESSSEKHTLIPRDFVDSRTSLNEHNPWSLSIKRVGP
ncbi:hypothetical protein CFAM422_004559 [Trichoderma lentiforme]|uniref:Uncharacterized protein n=1 Tax=Trichoderma lentiforme TaxID=1567552 RepID=A0A9P4XFE7_9HYPO|nr:hypothetical protein CFAM422_004559 [Trichoderma lentiforme]